MELISVLGSGTMGNGIAHALAIAGYRVNLIDISQKKLANGMNSIAKNLDRQVSKSLITEELKISALNHIQTFTDTQSGVLNSDLVIEAATENLEIKLEIFKNLDKFCKPEAILASNTSSISISKIASVTRRADKIIGMHFMNPVPLMKLVEVIRADSTSDQVTKTIMQLAHSLNKIPVEVNDSPGFVANRILMPMINEAIHTLDEGVAGVTEIDTVMKLGMAHPMGPLQLADFIGLDVCLAILNVLQEGFANPKYAPCSLLVNMVTAGNLGIKSGLGFYDYSNGSNELVISGQFRKGG
jgi:3-hydroxybutyryl-CoA dehydrogenase